MEDSESLAAGCRMAQFSPPHLALYIVFPQKASKRHFGAASCSAREYYQLCIVPPQTARNPCLNMNSDFWLDSPKVCQPFLKNMAPHWRFHQTHTKQRIFFCVVVVALSKRIKDNEWTQSSKNVLRTSLNAYHSCALWIDWIAVSHEQGNGKEHIWISLMRLHLKRS